MKDRKDLIVTKNVDEQLSTFHNIKGILGKRNALAVCGSIFNKLKDEPCVNKMQFPILTEPWAKFHKEDEDMNPMEFGMVEGLKFGGNYGEQLYSGIQVIQLEHQFTDAIFFYDQTIMHHFKQCYVIFVTQYSIHRKLTCEEENKLLTISNMQLSGYHINMQLQQIFGASKDDTLKS